MFQNVTEVQNPKTIILKPYQHEKNCVIVQKFILFDVFQKQ